MKNQLTIRHRAKALFQSKPEIIFVPAIVAWLLVNVPQWQIFGGESLAVLALKTGVLLGPTFTSVQDEIFPLTYSLIWVSIVFSLYLFRSRIRLNWIRSLVMCLTFPFAFVGTFEEIWQNLWVFRGLPPPLGNEIWMASWVVVGFSTLQYWRHSRKSLAMIIVLGIFFSIWVATGYDQLGSSSGLLVPALNLITKSLTFLLFATLLYEGSKLFDLQSRKLKTSPIVVVDKAVHLYCKKYHRN